MTRNLIKIAALITAGFYVGGVMADTLAERYAKLACAVVRIQTAKGGGTGFFIDANGTLVTAAHVVFNREGVQGGGRSRIACYAYLYKPFTSLMGAPKRRQFHR